MSPDSIATLRPQLTADGTAVRLPIGDYIAPLLDSLAVAYAEDPDVLGRLLRRHAASVVAADHAAVSEDATDYERAMRAAESDGSLDALLSELGQAAQVDHVMTPDEAITHGTRVTRLAARIRLAPKRTAR